MTMIDYFIFRDNPSERTLLGPSFTSPAMTPAACMEFCSPGGYGFAGVEFSQVRISKLFVGNRTEVYLSG